MSDHDPIETLRPFPPGTTTKIPVMMFHGPSCVTVAKLLKRNGITLAYDDRFLESACGDVLAKPTVEEATAWKKWMELADHE